MDKARAWTAHDEFATWVTDQLGGQARALLRPMFGGFGVYSEGVMLGIVYGDHIFLKTRDVREMGGIPFRPREHQTLWTFQLVPDDVIENVAALHPWVADALAAALRAQRQP